MLHATVKLFRVHESIISLHQTPTQRFFPFRVLIVRVLVYNHTVCQPKTTETFNYSLWETKPALEGEITLASGHYVQNHCERAIVQHSYCGLVVSKVFFCSFLACCFLCVEEWTKDRKRERQREKGTDHPKGMSPVSWSLTSHLLHTAL